MMDIAKLKNLLDAEIEQLCRCKPVLASEYVAKKRLDAVAQHAPQLLRMLAGKYIDDDNASDDLADCARIHLYARILDDALDENLPIHRQNLLRSQPMFWAAVGRLAMRHASLWPQTTRLIEETVAGVARDDADIDSEAWGLKNHHLLLIPLLLSGDSAGYRACRSGFSRVIWLIQAGDEHRQGRFQPVRDRFVDDLCDFMNGPQIETLAINGWKEAAERGVSEARKILTHC